MVEEDASEETVMTPARRSQQDAGEARTSRGKHRQHTATPSSVAKATTESFRRDTAKGHQGEAG